MPLCHFFYHSFTTYLQSIYQLFTFYVVNLTFAARTNFPAYTLFFEISQNGTNVNMEAKSKSESLKQTKHNNQTL